MRAGFSLKLNPLMALFIALFVLISGLVLATSIRGTYFLAGCLVLLCVFGCWRSALRVIPVMGIVGAIFILIAYYSSGQDTDAALRMGNRFLAIAVGIIPTFGIDSAAFIRSLNQIKCPRAITLGMLIAMSFVPLLKKEVSTVRAAMKTRGAGGLARPKVFYRAFLIPFVMRLGSISDTLALSVETRAYTLSGYPYSVYKKQYLLISDLFAGVLVIVGLVLAVVL